MYKNVHFFFRRIVKYNNTLFINRTGLVLFRSIGYLLKLHRIELILKYDWIDERVSKGSVASRLANGRSIILTDVISARFPDSLVGRLPENAAADCGHRVK